MESAEIPHVHASDSRLRHDDRRTDELRLTAGPIQTTSTAADLGSGRRSDGSWAPSYVLARGGCALAAAIISERRLEFIAGVDDAHLG
jgi:hypothetical protein